MKKSNVEKSIKAKQEKYKVYTYDVWGNSEDGYDVNDRFSSSFSVLVSPDDTEKDILDKLEDIGFLGKEGRTFATLDANCFDDHLYFVSSWDSKPLFELVKQE